VESTRHRVSYAIYDTYTTCSDVFPRILNSLRTSKCACLTESRSPRRELDPRLRNIRYRASFAIGQDPPVTSCWTNSNEYRPTRDGNVIPTRRTLREADAACSPTSCYRFLSIFDKDPFARVFFTNLSRAAFLFRRFISSVAGFPPNFL